MIDVLIIGGGAAGMTSALYAVRAGKTALVLEQETFGGQIAFSPRVENFPSVKQMKGSDFSDKLFEQITDLGCQVELEKVTSVVKNGKKFVVTTDYNTYQARTVVVAVGVKHRHLNIKNELDLVGKGVSYCATCDGAFYSGEEVALVGDGNTAMQYALLLSNSCPKVYLFTLFDRFFGDKALEQALRKKSNIVVLPNTSIDQLEEDNGRLTAVGYVDKKDSTRHTLSTRALFIAIGQVPDNALFASLTDLDKDGYIVADEECKTKTEGLFVAGDCRTKRLRQLTTAVADGATAGVNASLYIDKNF